jgi:predicted Zn-dependent protease
LIAVTCEAIGRRIGIQKKAELSEGTVERIHENQAFVGRYRAQTAQGTIGVRAAFISYGGRVFQISGLTAESANFRMAALFHPTLRSFRELTDPHLLNAQPDRITIHRSQAGETVRSPAGSATSLISAEEISRLDWIASDLALASGTLVKLIRPRR